jgi:pyridoxal phosphate enzyme (YggS family)
MLGRRMSIIADNITAVRTRIEAAAKRAGRDAASVRLIGASAAFKGVSVDQINAAMDAGLRDFGENRVQEAEAHIQALGPRAKDATWHLIGHLQTNKAKDALDCFDILQTVDSVRLAEQLGRRATKPIRILLEVNIAAETSKFGFAPSEVAAAVDAIRGLPNLELAGLMTVAPQVADPEQVRPYFRQLRHLAEAHGLTELSMGMTDDFEVAVEEGATMVRVGRAIFGARPS